jgi:hypothetical protein
MLASRAGNHAVQAPLADDRGVAEVLERPLRIVYEF